LYELDVILEELCGTMDVDVMPGPRDPSNTTLPQQPIHKCLFERASSSSSFHRVTNPYWCEVDGVV
jgi:DNA polymerase delta subunit 2